MTSKKPRKTACFDSINAISVWWALGYSVRGWNVLYFDRTSVGRLFGNMLGRVLCKRVVFEQIEYQVGDSWRLSFECTRIGVEFAEEMSEAARGRLVKSALGIALQNKRADAFVKKAMSLWARAVAVRMGVVETSAKGQAYEWRFVVDNSAKTRKLVETYQRLRRHTPRISWYPVPPAGISLLSFLAVYYAGIGLFVARRGISNARPHAPHLIAKPAMLGIGTGRTDDFLVDGKRIRPRDLIFYYYTNTLKQNMKVAAKEATEAGYSTVAWDRVPVQASWLFDLSNVRLYLISPLVHVIWSLFSFSGKNTLQVIRETIRLRKAMIGWDVFLKTHPIRCLFEVGVFEYQVAATMAVQRQGGIAIKIQFSEILDEFNENHQYLCHHYHFTWGRGVTELWENRARADHMIPVGYVWDSVHARGVEARESTRARYGVEAGTRLVAVFDTSVGKDNFISESMRDSFYDVLKQLANSLDDTVIVVKPKDSISTGLYTDADVALQRSVQNASLASNGSRPAARIIVEDHPNANTNELIAAADLVVCMAHSSTFIEALVCGVPALAFDKTGRDWSNSLPHSDQFVFADEDDICSKASEILEKGVEPDVWKAVQEKIRWNYGGVDGKAVDRIRDHILRACAVDRCASTAVQDNQLVSVGDRLVSEAFKKEE